MSRHAEVLKQCLPPVSYDPNAPGLSVELDAVGKQLDKAQESADQLQAEMFPSSCTVSLPDWERNYGLPDPCVTIDQSLEQRRAALESKINTKGGQSIAYFIALAEKMGYPGATVEEFPMFTCNSAMGDALNSEDDGFYWQLNLPAASGGIFFFTCNSAINSPLQSWGDEAIECRVRKNKPAHTNVIFAYP
jgi:uncharacterized protein YmfQ (DUF2313 family)